MKSIFETVDAILGENAFTDEELDNLMVELESAEPTLEERLDTLNLTRDKALDAACSDKKKYADLAVKIGVKNLNFPYVWIELVELCNEKNEPSKDKLELVLWLMVGGTFTENPELSDDEIISDWIHKSQKSAELKKFLTEFNRTADAFSQVTEALEISKVKYHAGKHNPIDSDRVFALLCNKNYAEKCRDKEILHNNLESLSGLIAEIPELEPIKPLIYFQAYVRYNKKLFENHDFAINPQKILEYYEYKISENNGKNYEQYALYCALYSDLKKCFPEADKPLCDLGFWAISNLAEWWYNLPFEGYIRSKGVNIPTPPLCLIREQCVSCFEKSPAGKVTSVSSEQLFKWRNRNSAIAANIEKAAESVRFGDLKSFADDSMGFCGRLFAEKKIGGIKPADHDIVWALLMKALENRFDELLEESLIDIIFRYRTDL